MQERVKWRFITMLTGFVSNSVLARLKWIIRLLIIINKLNTTKVLLAVMD